MRGGVVDSLETLGHKGNHKGRKEVAIPAFYRNL